MLYSKDLCHEEICLATINHFLCSCCCSCVAETLCVCVCEGKVFSSSIIYKPAFMILILLQNKWQLLDGTPANRSIDRHVTLSYLYICKSDMGLLWLNKKVASRWQSEFLVAQKFEYTVQCMQVQSSTLFSIGEGQGLSLHWMEMAYIHKIL